MSDPRYSASFYQMFALGGGTYRLWRPTSTRVFVQTQDETGRAISDRELSSATSALRSTLSAFGLPGDVATGMPQLGALSVRWSSSVPANRMCGEAAQLDRTSITIYYSAPQCRCGDVVSPLVVKHELGHALGFHHTDSTTDLMHPGGQGVCDIQPSEREMFHAQVAYSQPVGSR